MATAPQDSVIYANLHNQNKFAGLDELSAEQWERADMLFRDICNKAGIDSLDVNQIWAFACGILVASSNDFGPLAGLYVVNKAVTMVENSAPVKPSSL